MSKGIKEETDPPSCRELLALERREDIRLTPVERLLLVTDGTVTHLLEALTRGAVEVLILGRERNDDRLVRRVRLETQEGRPLLWARADVSLAQLEASIAERLVHGTAGIGRIIKQADIETRREVVRMSLHDPRGTTIPSFITGNPGPLLARTYRVYEEGHEIMTIREYFSRERL